MSEAEEIIKIEQKWVRKWEEAGIFEANYDERRKKIFVTFPFPYMNGPLHIGHGYTSARVDVYARFKRMQGYNVLFPWAWHLTGEPITGAAERVKRGDEAQIKIFREFDKVPEDELKKFTDPEYIARYYIRESKQIVKEFCHGIDWRREFYTTSLHKHFSKFIEWQYLTLREKGYVVKGTHPVVWCPHDRSPTGDHDRLQGEGASPVEFILLKFRFNNSYLVAATLRPETIFGVTNMWVNPKSTLAEINVDNEKWIVTKEAYEKIKEQKDNVGFIKEFPAGEIIGKYCEEPLNKRKIIILPASFVDPNSASGIVMSVPSHAPYDWLGLKDLLENKEELEKYGISYEDVKKIKPISLIKLENFGEHPAIEICEKMNIKNQLDEKADKATEIIYKEEFYKGILKENTEKYAGYRVNEVKKLLIKDFEEQNIASNMWELSEKVVCRCGTECIVKILKDQWFLDYGNEEWKNKVREALKKIKISPEDARANFENTIDWLEAKACARRSGLGTPLPWDKSWIVETLSDSTVYMAFYTIAREINQGKIDADSLTKEVFDFIFYGKGNADEVSEKYKIDKHALLRMQREFNYFMPVDLRVSAKELIPNHLTFFIFQHVALFSEEKWPRYIGVNGMISIEGEKMSKSKGNFITLKDAIRNYSASVTRATLLYAAEGLKDPDWRGKNAKEMLAKLNSFYSFVSEIIEKGKKQKNRIEQNAVERWLISRMQRHIESVANAIEDLNTRTAFQAAFFDVFNDIKWYMRKAEKVNYGFLLSIVKTWLKLLAPFIPAICEELWEKAGEAGFISVAEFPEVDNRLVDDKVEQLEEMLIELIEDIKSIIKATSIKPERIFIYTASSWKWKAYEKILGLRERKVDIGMVMKELNREPELSEVDKKELANFAKMIIKRINELRIREKIDEKKFLSEAKSSLEKEFACVFEIYSEEEKVYDPKNRKRFAIPGKPAIYME